MLDFLAGGGGANTQRDGSTQGFRPFTPGGGLAKPVALLRALGGEPDFAPSFRLPTSPCRVGSRQLRRTSREATRGKPLWLLSRHPLNLRLVIRTAKTCENRRLPGTTRGSAALPSTKPEKQKGCVGLTPSASFGIENLELARGLVVTPLPPATFSPLTPAAAAITPTAFTPTVSPIPPAIMPIAPSGQLGATLVGILFGLFDHRVADASDSFRN